MRRSKNAIIVGYALTLAGCSIHPLPEDVTRETTYRIVQKIRCEAREALTELSVAALRESRDAGTHDLAARVEAGHLQVTALFEDPRYHPYVDPNVGHIFRIFALSAVAFDFTFTITENNDSLANAKFRMPFTSGLFTLGLAAGMELARQNERKLKTGDTFLELYEKAKPEGCWQIAAGGANFIYPITGKIGLFKVFRTFYLMNRPFNPNLSGPLGEVETFDITPGSVRDVTDTLTFTTTLSAAATPAIELDPISAHQFRLASASATLAGKRMDIHKVAISVEIGAPVTSLAQARSMVGLRARAAPLAEVAKRKAFRRLDELRTEDFFTQQRDLRRRVDQLEER